MKPGDLVQIGDHPRGAVIGHIRRLWVNGSTYDETVYVNNGTLAVFLDDEHAFWLLLVDGREMRLPVGYVRRVNVAAG
jgi:hypothetical protein